MRSLPTVSVVVLNFNGLKHLKACFESLSALNYPADKLELILVDNGSRESPAALMAERFPAVHTILNEANAGFAEGSNIGARAASGKYVAFLNNDTHVHPDWLIKLVEAVDPENGVVSAGSRILDWEGKTIDFVGAELNFYGHGFQEAFRSGDVGVYREPREVLFACGGAMLIDRRIFLDAGGFDADYFAFFEDVDLGWRLWLLGYKVVLQPASIVYHRLHGTASSLKPWLKYVMYERNAVYTIIKNYDDENLAKILPVAILLSVKRGLVNSGIKKEDYYLPGAQPVSLELPVSVELTGSPAAGETPTRIARLKTSLKEEGVAETGRKLGRKVRAVLAGQPDLPPHADMVSRLGMSHFIGLDDVLMNLPLMFEKRARIQAKRKRSDAEVLALFGQPFKANCLDPDFLKGQAGAVSVFGIDRIFKKGVS